MDYRMKVKAPDSLQIPDNKKLAVSFKTEIKKEPQEEIEEPTNRIKNEPEINIDSSLSPIKQEPIYNYEVFVKEEFNDAPSCIIETDSLAAWFDIEQQPIHYPYYSDVPLSSDNYNQTIKDQIKIEEPASSLIPEKTASFLTNENSSVRKKPKKPAIRQPKTKEYIFPTNCELCDEILLNIEHYVEHTMNHSVIRSKALESERVQYAHQFQCKICGKSYQRKSHYNEHMYTHSDCKFICDICGKSFKVPRYLREHKLKVMHKRTNSKGSNKQRAK